MNFEHISIDTQTHPHLALVTLNRPEKHNAFDDNVIAALTKIITEIDENPNIRAMVLTGSGKSFSAGADLNYMKRMKDFSQQENKADSLQLAGLMHKLNNMQIPTICLVNGATYGGGVGLVACCDIAIASQAAKFCLSEVKLGLAPAVISPYVIKAIGQRNAQRYFVTGELFDALQAEKMGLVHEVCPAEELTDKGVKIAQTILKNGPKAVKTCKQLVQKVSGKLVNDELIDYTADLIATMRSSDEAQEGLSAFLDKRNPTWNKK